MNDAGKFCQEFMAEYDKTEDPEEKIILLNVLTKQVNEWTLGVRLKIIQEKSKNGNAQHATQ